MKEKLRVAICQMETVPDKGENLKKAREMLAEAGVRLLLHTQLVEVERQDEAVSALIVFNKSGLQRLACQQVVDATGDADVVARGCWPFEKGGPVFLPTGELHISEEAGEVDHLRHEEAGIDVRRKEQ